MADVVEFTERKPGSRKVQKTEKTDVRQALGTKEDAESAAKRPLRSARSAVAMKIAGASYSDIARVLEYTSPAAARVAVETALAASADMDTDYKSARAIASAQLDGLLRAVYTQAIDKENVDQLAYQRQALSVIDRKIKLHGIDAPQMITVVDPTAEEFERVVTHMMDQVRTDDPVEGDIFALEQAPDGATWSAADNEPEDSYDE